ncbi:MAG: hypothetical protein UV64_C0027G0002 [Parcubacteria group bacterium GW2011_GWC1_43_11b]|nr:MAG: hypothetical protein UV50_C0006G0060 [Parcubacteria group bacterium GW2011_GWB1_42_9]KKS88191.1 MAG: hypothetical protein UV64_C0027G0002 [Parcubacteria group bacterium GW2011_GWC1_43_11b]KKT08937.1 MAG: hypothetical protein UV88_C0017G0007 [Parcubacteria group bacterium GW2011_GWA1_43_21]
MEVNPNKQNSDFKTRTYLWTLSLVKLIEKMPKSVFGEVVSKQVLRSGTSIIANYIEAKAASSRKDFTNFFNHALKSANESKVWLALIRDTTNSQKIKDQSKILLVELDEIAKILGASLLKLRGKK